MLEKLGLPPKPAARGSSWVVDASHCQTCATAFSLFNRKHHCRRCGGIFCGVCAQNRLVLRGQGDTPVRVCEACKKLEDATRFEARYARKAKIQKVEDSFGGDWNGKEEDATSSLDQAHTNRKDLSVSMQKPIDTSEQLPKELVSPEALRQQSKEEKNNYAFLKREGKNAEALKAFKRAKELERQADALALSIRKSVRLAATASQASTPSDVQPASLFDQSKVKHSIVADRKGEKQPSQVSNDPKGKKAPLDEKDEFAEALKELGWSEAEISKSGTVKNSVQPPSSSPQIPKDREVLAEVTLPHGSISASSMQMEILGHKRRALALKREGNLAEAKAELKKAKLLERQLEKLEAANSEEESDDELAVLMKGLEKTEKAELRGLSVSSSIPKQEIQLDAQFWTSIADGDDDNDPHELVTEEDMNDPDMISALRSMGWMEEASALESFSAPADVKAKLSIDELMGKDATEEKMHDPQMFAMLQAFEPDQEPIMQQVQSVASAFNPHQISALQQEILLLKRAALSLKREGKADQAKEELRQAKLLEQKLLKVQAQHSAKEQYQKFSVDYLKQKPLDGGQTGESALEEADESVEVSDRDMHDPELMAILKGMGWQEEDMLPEESSSEMQDVSPERVNASQPTSARLTSQEQQALLQLDKSKLQKSLLGIKRKALMLRREGKFDEAEEQLKAANKLDRQLEQLQALQEEQKIESISTHSAADVNPADTFTSSSEGLETEEDEVTVEDLNDPSMVAALVEMGWNDVQNETVQSSVQIELKHHHKPTKFQAIDPISRSNLEFNKWDAMKLPGDTRLSEKSQVLHDLQRVPEQFSRRHKLESKEEKLHDEVKYAEIGGMHKDMGSIVNDRMPSDVLIDSGTKHRHDDGTQGASSSTTSKAPTILQAMPARKGSPLLQTKTPTEAGYKESIPSSKSLDNSFSVGHTSGLPNESFLSTSNPNRDPDIVSTSIVSTDSLQQEILAYKRRALAYKREGKQADAKKELAHAKMLEKHLGSRKVPTTGDEPVGVIKDTGTSISAIQSTHEETKIGAPSAKVTQEGNQTLKTLTENDSTEFGTPARQHVKKGRDRMNLQRESLAHKRKALALRREGKIEEADTEFQLAKSLEQKMEELEDADSGSAFKHGNQSSLLGQEDVVDDVLDPQLLSALKGLGWKEADIFGDPEHKLPKAAEPSQSYIESLRTKKTDSILGSSHGGTQLPGDKNKGELEQKIKAYKLQALEFKRAGKQGDALTALREAKRLEKLLLSPSCP